MTTDYGSDLSGVRNIDFGLSFVDGRIALAEALLTRLSSGPGSLPDDPAYGYDMQLLIGSMARSSEVESRVVAQCLLDERVEDVQADVTLVNGTLTVALSVVDADGPFALVLTLTDSTIEMILPEAT